MLARRETTIRFLRNLEDDLFQISNLSHRTAASKQRTRAVPVRKSPSHRRA